MCQTLLDKAKTNFSCAEIIYREAHDENYLIYAGFWLQQAAELAMLYLFDKDGAELPETHDLDQIIRIAKEQGVDLHLTQYITEHAETFALWAERKDLPNYRIERWKVERAMEGVKEFLDFIDLAFQYGGETFTTGLAFEKALRHALETLEESEFAKYVKEAILFGSCARGEQHDRSDVDLALVIPKDFYESMDDDERRRFRLLLSDMSYMPCRDAYSPEVETCSLYEGWKEAEDNFFKQCLERDGKVVWKNPEYQDTTL